MATLNTAAKTRDEGNWQLTPWLPTIATEAEMDTFVGDLLQRANDTLRYRVGPTWYTANSTVDPYDKLLKEAEMHLCQAQLLLAAAGVTETGLDTNPAPFLGTAKEILLAAEVRKAWAEEIILSTRAFGSDARPTLETKK